MHCWTTRNLVERLSTKAVFPSRRVRRSDLRHLSANPINFDLRLPPSIDTDEVNDDDDVCPLSSTRAHQPDQALLLFCSPTHQSRCPWRRRRHWPAVVAPSQNGPPRLLSQPLRHSRRTRCRSGRQPRRHSVRGIFNCYVASITPNLIALHR